MNIETFVNRIETYTPTGFTFWCGLRRAHYNTEKTIGNVMLMVLPTSWPAMWREGCRYRITFEIWFGVVEPINRTTIGTQQHDPYSPLEDVQGIHDTARAVLAAIGLDAYISIVNEPNMVFYDQPDGQSVNSQIWLQVPIEADTWKFTATPVPTGPPTTDFTVVNELDQFVLTESDLNIIT